MMTEQHADKILLKTLRKAKILARIETDKEFLYLAPRSDVDEGRFLPFFSVNKKTQEVSDFDPTEHEEPNLVARLQAMAQRNG